MFYAIFFTSALYLTHTLFPYPIQLYQSTNNPLALFAPSSPSASRTTRAQRTASRKRVGAKDALSTDFVPEEVADDGAGGGSSLGKVMKRMSIGMGIFGSGSANGSGEESTVVSHVNPLAPVQST